MNRVGVREEFGSNTFFGVFSYWGMETASCAHHIYFDGIVLQQDIRELIPLFWKEDV